MKLFRIQQKNKPIASGKPAVFLQHGIFDSADSWVINGEQNSLGLVLANLGYDVWFGNSRGNKYSRLNRHISPNRREFWDFSFQEMGEFDIKANLGFVTSITSQSKVTYVGHSQGTSQMFAGLSDPKISDFINSKVQKFIALAPVVYLANTRSTFFVELAKDNFLIDAAELFGIDEWLPGACSKTSKQSEFEHYVCTHTPVFCDIMLSIMDYNPKYDNEKVLPLMAQHMPSGSSLRSLIHYKQLIESNKHNPKFQKFDFGLVENLKKYGQKSPPAYDLNLIRSPVRSFIGVDDLLGDTVDNSFVTAHLQSLGKDYKEYTYENCGHATFLIAKDASPIFKDVLKEISG